MTTTLRRTITALTLLAASVFAAGTALAETTVTYLINDGLGSPIAAMDEQGAVVWRKDYQPYGSEYRQDPAATEERIGYTGHVHDTSTGLTYMGARYYDPVIGRFMAADPVGFDESNPMSFSRYGYANSNPYRYVDPDGQAIIIPLVIYAAFEAINLYLEAHSSPPSNCGNDCVVSSGFGIPGPIGGKAVYQAGKTTGATVAKGLDGVPVETFAGTIKRRVLKSDTDAFRFSGGVSDPKGRFLTTRQTLRQIDSPQDAQRVLQLPEGATADALNKFTIPKGTEIFMGRVKGGPPGATQVFIKNPGVLK